jgi:hypothetical protein
MKTRVACLFCLGLALTTACGGKDPSTGGTTRQPGNDNDGGTTGNSSALLTARIVRPNGQASVLSGSAVTLEAELFYGSSALSLAAVTWTSDGLFLGSDNPLTGVTFLPGEHTVAVSVSYAGETATDSTTLTVGDLEVRIQSPTDGVRREVGAAVAFDATARVTDGATTTALVSGTPVAAQRQATYAWSSSRDGALSAQAGFASSSLTVGTHVVTLTVTDDLAGGSGKSRPTPPQR